jgi:hypothetical protein
VEFQRLGSVTYWRLKDLREVSVIVIRLGCAEIAGDHRRIHGHGTGGACGMRHAAAIADGLIARDENMKMPPPCVADRFPVNDPLVMEKAPVLPI